MLFLCPLPISLQIVEIPREIRKNFSEGVKKRRAELQITDRRCTVNIYPKEDKYFREHSGRIRKIFIFANCLTQNKGSDGGVDTFSDQEKEETFVVLRGRIRVITYNDDGTIIDDIVLNPSEGRYGVNVGKNVWHTVEALEPGSIIFECKEGSFVEHEEEGILIVDK